MNGLMLHAGSKAVTREQLHESYKFLPAATDSFRPIPHMDLVTLVEANLKASGLSIVQEAFGLSKDQQRMFGMLELRSDLLDYAVVIGVRNSNDKTFPAALATGDRVFVCDNLAFSSEVVLARKHTTFILRDLPTLVVRAVAKLDDARQKQARRIEAYKNVEISNAEAHDLVIRALDMQVAPVTRIPAILKEWRQPKHDVFQARTLWSLRNGFTEALKGTSVMDLPRRTQALHGILDLKAGLMAPARNMFEALAEGMDGTDVEGWQPGTDENVNNPDLMTPEQREAHLLFPGNRN